MDEKHLVADVPCKALIRRGSDVLLVKEPDGMWALPGGRMHEGEMPREALKREMMEETGLEIEVGNVVDFTIFTSKSGMHHFVVVFAATLLSEIESAVFDPKEVVELKWIPMADLKGLPLFDEYKTIALRDEYKSLLAKIANS